MTEQILRKSLSSRASGETSRRVDLIHAPERHEG
jgi:hypothetical protein